MENFARFNTCIYGKSADIKVTMAQVAEDNMQPRPFGHRTGCPANKYRPHFSCGYGKNQILINETRCMDM